MLLPVTFHLMVDDVVLVHAILYQLLELGSDVVVALFTTPIVQFGWKSPIPALLSIVAFASRPFASVKSKPSMNRPVLFQELLVIEMLLNEVNVVG